MKWTEKKRPQHGEIRRRKAFLFLPKKILREVRWLCLAEWYERWHDAVGSPAGTASKAGWRPFVWVDSVSQEQVEVE